MKKNVSGQVIGAQMVSASDGSAFTGSVTVYVTGDAGTQAVGSVSSGACTHEGNGFHTYAPAQAETNYDHIAFTFIGSGAVPATVQVYPSFPQTGDSYARLGAPAGASISADIATIDDFLDTEVAAIKAKTDNLPSDPADASDIAASFSTVNSTLSTIAGYIDTEVAAIKAKTDNLPASPAATGDCITAAGVRTAIGLASANLDTQLSTIDGVVDSILVDTAEIGAAGAGLTAVPWNAAWDAEVQSEVADALTAYDAATGTDVSSAAITVSAIVDAVWDEDLSAHQNSDSAGEALTAAGAAGSGLTTGAIADAVWDEALSGHLSSGSTGEALNAAGAAGDPWIATLPGSYTSGQAGYIVGTNLNATVSSRATQASVDAVDDFLDTEVAAIKGVTDKIDTTLIATSDGYAFTGNALENAPTGSGLDAAGVRAAIGLASANLDTQLGAIDDFLDTEVAAIKAKTDNLPSDPADASDIAASFSTVNSTLSTIAGYIDTEVAAIKAKTDNLPASPAASGDCLTAAGVRSAIGLASANLDTQLSDIASDLDVVREYGDNTVVRGTCSSTASTTSLTPSALSPSGAAADQFKGRILIFDNDTTTTALRGQATDITASSNASLAVLTFTALTTAPSNGDTFSIV